MRCSRCRTRCPERVSHDGNRGLCRRRFHVPLLFGHPSLWPWSDNVVDPSVRPVGVVHDKVQTKGVWRGSGVGEGGPPRGHRTSEGPEITTGVPRVPGPVTTLTRRSGERPDGPSYCSTQGLCGGRRRGFVTFALPLGFTAKEKDVPRGGKSIFYFNGSRCVLADFNNDDNHKNISFSCRT